MKRHWINEIKDKIGETVELFGWVNVRRDHGKIIFIDLRDRSGICQLVFTPQNEELYKIAESLRPEWVLQVKGEVAERPKGMENPEIETGKVEVKVEEFKVLSQSETPPFPLDSAGHEIEEELRLKHRYLDLRRERLKNNLILRHRLAGAVRDYLNERGFLEVETPILTKSTPEGARDYVVPSRLYPGSFYALAQSPQQYKQLLMVAGIEKYFQIARAFRDEDTRGDRQPEHTQIDIEMSFVKQKDVMNLIEDLIIRSVEKIGGKRISQKPFPVFSYQEARTRFGADKFDLRKSKDDKDELAFAWVIDFPVFEKNDGKWNYSHNPFTAPKDEYLDDLMSGKNIGGLVSLQYDLVCNGYEVGGGGIRIHQSHVLEKVFEILGHSKESIHKQFGHMLEAFSFGVPPHGGIALGLDRLVMILAGEPNIREVIAFPKTGDARDPLMGSPSEIDKEQLKELHLGIKKK
ncbi:MAG: aspartate--tRNA ligase [Parcubacteria group bacterium]|nr:aspartate--tRNA ligase [Parcubacteria group bacterium]